MVKFNFVFVVLVYRNTIDLEEFFNSLSLDSAKVIVVNSFYDETSEKSFREIANLHNADFITVPNKGYGAGNNEGCRYAINNYRFDYLIISNADILIEKFDLDVLKKYGGVIIAPKILNLKGKNQNPSVPFVPSQFSEKIRLWVFVGNHKKILWLLHIASRFNKIIYYLIHKHRMNIFSAHGAFVVFPYNIILKLHPVYNEKMFLLGEEEHLGRLALLKSVNTVYAPDIIIRHKEDGSMKMASKNEFNLIKQSFIEYYHYWFSQKK